MRGLWSIAVALLSIVLSCDAELSPRQEINETALSQLSDLNLPRCGVRLVEFQENNSPILLMVLL